MVKKSDVPNAWEDDDWESQADKEAQEPAASAAPAPLTKKERLAQHAELNRKIWETAPFKAPMTVLARKPMIAKRDPVTGLSTMTPADDDDDDEANKKPQETPEEIRARQQREREEKQKRYDEMRAKIFGETTGSGTSGGGAPGGSGAGRGGSGRSSGNSTPGNVTPPAQRTGGERRGRGRARGGYRGGRGGGGDGGNERFSDRGGERSEYQRPTSQPGAGGAGGSDLYDPSYSPKPTSTFDRRGNNMGGGAPLSGRSTPRDDDQVIRAPRGPPASGPDNGGRGGFGFAKRGAKEG
ncbi:uncharacterized protein PG998_005377 [Apiospora kogelbergensis]|uniref:uncharacterized protein n=1 Tax=Apiospora kogelbergensis TaxID=1337665 RepID=UPI0031308FBC